MDPYSGIDVHQLTRALHVKNDSKIVMLVADGLGGLPLKPAGKTELEMARTPNLDALARVGIQGGTIPVFPGIAPGSGPGHLALFGYDPIQFQIGRGALEATGIGFELLDGDVAARGNFCTLDAQGRITDRRAGRIASEASAAIVRRMQSIKVPGVELFVEPVKEHRFVVVFRGAGEGHVADTDPQAVGVEPLAPVARDRASEPTARAAAEFVAAARRLVAAEPHANGLTLRGFAARPKLESYEQVYGLRAAAIAVYPMYRGLASLVGMKNIGQPKTLDEQVDLLAAHWRDYDFFFLHFKYTDSTGEDGDFEAKVRRIEEFDAVLPRVNQLRPDVLIVTGDHSTPSFLKVHSWHPVPTLLVSNCCRPDHCTAFAESESYRGGLGLFPAKFLMPLALANAGRMSKFGA